MTKDQYYIYVRDQMRGDPSEEEIQDMIEVLTDQTIQEELDNE